MGDSGFGIFKVLPPIYKTGLSEFNPTNAEATFI